MPTHRPVPLNTAVPEAYRTVIALDKQCTDAALAAGLDPLVLELVRIRASQLNGCAFCLKMHVRDTLAKGESTDRIAVLSAWRDTTYFTDTERAALQIAEDVTLIGQTPAADREPSALTDEQAAAVRWMTIVINAFNRIAKASHYEVAP